LFPCGAANACRDGHRMLVPCPSSLPQLSLGDVNTLAPRLANASFVPPSGRSLGLFFRVVRNDVRVGVSRVGVPDRRLKLRCLGIS
jgi:hypothetical protein